MAEGSSTRWAIWLIVGCVVAVLLFVGAALATDRPGFCPTCHEMKPYNEAWAAGAHKDVWCIDCHVSGGVPGRFAHKFVALGEVWSHVTGDTSFPRQVPAEVPDSRCQPCHEKVVAKEAPKGFDHASHEKVGTCQFCHAKTGHDVTSDALVAAGVYDQVADDARSQTAAEAGKVATPGGGAANLTGHPDVTCSQCHDMAKTPCASCHKAPTEDHPGVRVCGQCHAPGSEWTFTHPDTGECATCHKGPEGDHPQNPQCAFCHTAKSWEFKHPTRGMGEHDYKSFKCIECHPRLYTEVACTCHKNGVPSD